jgi:hypothetical protein
MNRADLQQLATIRLTEAQALLAAGFPAGAYYLAGYAVECALKACIAKGVQQYEFPDKDRVNRSYSHNLADLLRLAGLEMPLNDAIKNNSDLGENWTTVKDWQEATRYALTITATDAADLILAISDPQSGVLPWLVPQW